MAEYILENEGFSSKAAEKAFKKFNRLLDDKDIADKLQCTIGLMALQYDHLLDRTGRQQRRVVNKVLNTTDNGKTLGAPEKVWAEIFDNPDHRQYSHFKEKDLGREEVDSRCRTRGLTALRLVAMLNARPESTGEESNKRPIEEIFPPLAKLREEVVENFTIAA